MAELSSEEIAHLGRLSRIELSEEERSRFAGQLSSVVEYIEQLSEVDTSGVAELRGVTGLQNIYAEDVERLGVDPLKVQRTDLLKGTPAHEGDYIEVRAVLEGNEESA